MVKEIGMFCNVLVFCLLILLYCVGGDECVVYVLDVLYDGFEVC